MIKVEIKQFWICLEGPKASYHLTLNNCPGEIRNIWINRSQAKKFRGLLKYESSFNEGGFQYRTYRVINLKKSRT